MSNKPELVFCGPVATVSGYGSHARDLVLSLIKMDKYNVKIISINWGETPMNALDENNSDHKEILNRIAKEQMTSQPDIWVQCTIPTEFQPVGKYNIGITAGIETNICSPEWVEGCNRMDLIIVPSKHAKDVFVNTVYEKRDKQTNQTIENHRITKPIEVLHEGVRTDLFGKDAQQNVNVTNMLDDIKEDFVFLFVGHWLKGDFGNDRKDVSGLIYTFLKTFAGKENAPALLLKTSMGTFSITGRNEILRKIDSIKNMVKLEKLPNIYLLNGDLDETDMNTLYHHDKIKSFISFTKGEGYGRPIAEFMTTGKPIMVPKWSGHLDFIESDVNVLLEGELKEVHDSAIWETVINKGSSWFNVDYTKASEKMKDVFSKYNIFLKKSKLALISMKTKWSYNKMHDRFESIMNTNVPKFAVKSEIKLPKLNKISD
jgi:hypothetical protein